MKSLILPNNEDWTTMRIGSLQAEWTCLTKVAPLVSPRVRPFNGERYYLATGDLRGDGIGSLVRVTYRSRPSRADLQVMPGDVIYARMMDTPKVLRISTKTADIIVSTGFAVHRPDASVVNGRYLYYYLQSPRFQQAKDRFCKGATQKAITNDDIRQITIPLFPLPLQERIACALANANHLRRLRRYARALSDTYLESVFLEMFGDPVMNSMGWDVAPLRKVASINRGKFTPRPRNDPRYYGGNYPFIQTGDIARSGSLLTNYTQTLNEKGIRVSRAFDPGTVVIAIVGATIGEVATLGIRAYCPDSVIGIVTDPACTTTEFIERLLRFWKPIFRARAPETARANINLETLRPVPIPLPPMSLQRRYSAIVHSFERLRAQHCEAERQAEHLFQTLLHGAFDGEI